MWRRRDPDPPRVDPARARGGSGAGARPGASAGADREPARPARSDARGDALSMYRVPADVHGGSFGEGDTAGVWERVPSLLGRGIESSLDSGAVAILTRRARMSERGSARGVLDTSRRSGHGGDRGVRMSRATLGAQALVIPVGSGRVRGSSAGSVTRHPRARFPRSPRTLRREIWRRVGRCHA